MISSNDQNQGCPQYFRFFNISVFRSTKLINEQLHLLLDEIGILPAGGHGQNLI